MTPPDSSSSPSLVWSLVGICALFPLAGCGHTDPFSTPATGSEQPFDASPPIRLTFNQGPDRNAAWLPDGSAFFYSGQQQDRRDHDVCLALLPSTGGHQLQLTCDLPPDGATRTDALESAAPATDGRLAFVAASSGIGAASPTTEALVLSPLRSPDVRRVVQAVPYRVPGGRQHSGISQLAWLGQHRVLYLGETVLVSRACDRCPLDTLRSGLDATVLGIDVAGAVPEPVPGTDFASSVSPGTSEDDVYYTLAGDSRVYHRSLSSGAVSVVHDFGAEGIARDVSVVGSRMAVVVGGRVVFGVDPLRGPLQWDSGGIVHLVSIGEDSDLALTGPGLFRRPRISPSGSSIVAEGYPLIITEVATGEDTTVSRDGDLYLFGQP
jgi:WD40-like Beta Propeller Repeat